MRLLFIRLLQPFLQTVLSKKVSGNVGKDDELLPTIRFNLPDETSKK